MPACSNGWNSAGGGAWHVDAPLGQIAEPLPEFPLTLQNVWMLDDFTADNGATRVMPRSHKLRKSPPWGSGPLDGEVDLAAIVSKLPNVAAQRQLSSVEGEPVPQQAQAGDPAYRKPAFEVPEEPSDFNYGRRATDAVWRRPNRS